MKLPPRPPLLHPLRAFAPACTRRIAITGVASLAAAALAGCATPRSDAELDALKRVRFEDTPDGARAVLDESILFEFGKADFAGSADAVIDALRPVFARARGSIVVEGHTDSLGAPAFNLDLSRRRAERVRDELIKRQVAPERIVARGMGSSKPRRSPETTELDRRLNRRAELLFPGETVASLGGNELERRSDSTLQQLSRSLGDKDDKPAASGDTKAGDGGDKK